MRPSGSRVFTIPPGVPFLPALADGLLDGTLSKNAPLADVLLYLPSRRAGRALADILIRRNGGRALLLPRVVPLGEAADAGEGFGDGFETVDVAAPPIRPLERRLVLTRLIQAWSGQVGREMDRLSPGSTFRVPASPANAVELAADLETLVDALAAEEVPWDGLDAAVEAEHSHHFELTARFLRIAAENWPKVLAERNASDPAQRRVRLLRAEAERLERERPDTPVIAAGSTGALPATAALLAAVAELPRGAVVLPGLDTDLDEAGWTAIGPEAGEIVHGHPQAAFRRLLASLRLERSAVATLGRPGGAARARERMLSEALRPAETTDRWADLPPDERRALAEEGMAGLCVVEAADEREEALAAAVALRETLATPGRTAVLVTPDRGLAARVAAELARWNVSAADAAAVPLSDTAAGRLARLAADAALGDGPARLPALLAHPDARLGLSRAALERGRSAIEIGVLRGPNAATSLDGLVRALEAGLGDDGRNAPRPRRRLTAEDWDLAALLIGRLTAALGDLAAAAGEDDADYVHLAAAHRRAVEALGEPAAVAGADLGPEPARDGSEALRSLFDDLRSAGPGAARGRAADYPAFFAALSRRRLLPRDGTGSHPRLRILGLLEARLVHADRVVLGGLAEGVWPPRTRTDAFLNRPMRAAIGLAPPERRIGEAAHDFVQALGTADAVITRARKRDGQPAAPSRFLSRTEAFVGPAAWGRARAGGDRLLALARSLDRRPPAPPPKRPAPRPDPALFPRALSVTEVETLIRDPYAIFARHVLGLDPLEPIAPNPGAANRGLLVHEALARFAAAFPAELPPAPGDHLLRIGGDLFAPLAVSHPELHADWWPRFRRLVAAIVPWEEKRRAGLERIHPEAPGSWRIPLSDGTVFTLRARADRIEAGPGGTRTIVDFKTGEPPSAADVFAGFAPQLTLQAAMLRRGAFGPVGRPATVPDLVYVHVGGGRTAREPKPLAPPRGETRTLAELVDEHENRFRDLLERFLSGEAGFASRPHPRFDRVPSPFDHLARVKEWSLAGTDGEDGP